MTDRYDARHDEQRTARLPDLSIEDASVALGMAPTAVIRLLESGRLPSHLGPDGRRRRVARADIEAHRHERFALRQQMVQEQRARKWADSSGVAPGPDDVAL